jgi:hypothetical protein
VTAADQDSDAVCDASDNCPTVANAGQANQDGDTLGDACDPCTGGSGISASKFAISKLATGPGDDTFKLSGLISLPPSPPVDPIAKGFRLILSDSGGVLRDIAIPAGAINAATKIGWATNATQTKFQYKNADGIDGITKIKLQASTKVPNGFLVKIGGKRGSYLVAAARQPVHVVLIIDTPNATTGQCAERDYTAPACLFDSKGNTFKCK